MIGYFLDLIDLLVYAIYILGIILRYLRRMSSVTLSEFILAVLIYLLVFSRCNIIRRLFSKIVSTVRKLFDKLNKKL